MAYIQRESAPKTCFDSELAAMCGMTSSRGISDKYLDMSHSKRHDVTGLQTTSSRRCVDDVEHVTLDYQQHQQPTSTQYISDTCVLLTYFTGDIDSNVDEHFARALSRPSSFGPNYHGTTPPSVHTGISTRFALCMEVLNTLYSKTFASDRFHPFIFLQIC